MKKFLSVLLIMFLFFSCVCTNAVAAPLTPEILNVEGRVLAYYNQKVPRNMRNRWIWWKMRVYEYIEEQKENGCELSEECVDIIFLQPLMAVKLEILLSDDVCVRRKHMLRYINQTDNFFAVMEGKVYTRDIDPLYGNPWFESYLNEFESLFRGLYKDVRIDVDVCEDGDIDIMEDSLRRLVYNPQYREDLMNMCSELDLAGELFGEMQFYSEADSINSAIMFD